MALVEINVLQYGFVVSAYCEVLHVPVRSVPIGPIVHHHLDAVWNLVSIVIYGSHWAHHHSDEHGYKGTLVHVRHCCINHHETSVFGDLHVPLHMPVVVGGRVVVEVLLAIPGGFRVFVFSVRAVKVAVVDLVYPDLGSIHAIEPVDRVPVFVVLLLVRTVLAVLVFVVHPVEGNLVPVTTEERHFAVLLH